MSLEWTHTYERRGPFVAARITSGEREIGWHLQDSKSNTVFFVKGPDVTESEAARYSQSLKDKNFQTVSASREEFRQFLNEQSRAMDAIFVMLIQHTLRL